MSVIFTERVLCNYNKQEERIIENNRNIFLIELENLQLEKQLLIFENQQVIASNVIDSFTNRKIINTMVVSKTQSGKTGSMCATIKRYLEQEPPYNRIPIENIYIITGLSSCEWVDQTKTRIPLCMKNRLFHRNQLYNFADEIRDKKNILIIIDEIHIATKKNQIIYAIFESAGLLNKSKLYENDIKILEYSATPDGTIYDLMKWNDASCKIIGEAGDGYISCYNLFKMGRVKQYKPLCHTENAVHKTVNAFNEKMIFKNIEEIKEDIIGYPKPLYHIIRTKTGFIQDTIIENFKRVFNVYCYDFIRHDGESEIKDINRIISIKPEKHTFIFIKEMLRCSKTLEKKYIGILYDRYRPENQTDDSVIIQGLIGRNTGYDNNGISICYTNIESIKKYEKLWRSNFEDTSFRWRSKTTQFKKNILLGESILSGKKTINDPENYGVSSREIISQEIKLLIYSIINNSVIISEKDALLNIPF